MANAICMIELSSIARGIEVCDAMVKAARVEPVKASTVCPGKYVVILAGDTGDVNAAMARGKAVGAEYVVDTLIITNVHEQLIPAISMTNQVTVTAAIGALEFFSIASAIKAADTAAKAAQITLIEVKIGYAIGGKGVVTLTGEVGAVRAAVEAAKHESELLIGTTVIPHPAPQLVQTLL